MSSNKDVIQVIDRTALIENVLNQIIEKYCKPRKEAFYLFWSVILDSSIIQLGAKVKIAMAISQELDVKLDQNALHQLISYRNAFAHHAINSHPTVVMGKIPEDNELYYSLQVIKQSGKIEKKRRGEAIEEFNKYFEQAKCSLLNLLEAIKAEASTEKKTAP